MYGHGPEVAARINAWKLELAAELAQLEKDAEIACTEETEGGMILS